MTGHDKEQQIRARAHAIWEEQGRPEGQHGAHWEQARREIEQESKDEIGGMPIEPAEGDRETVERELDRQATVKARQPRKPAAAPKGGVDAASK